MEPLYTDIESAALENTAYRDTIYTDRHCQVVLMHLKARELIPAERHRGLTQFIRVEKGRGRAKLNGVVYELYKGTAITIPANTLHEIKAITNLHLYTVYCGAPAHPPGTYEETP